MTLALIVHGGAGTWRPGSDDDALAGIRRAVEAGRAILRQEGSALDAACASAVVLEDDPVFNAGTGAVLNFDGFVEFEACVMTSHDKGMGAVSGLQRVKNPIRVARQVMEMTDHVMLTGDGALRFARAMGHADHDPITPARLADWQDKKAKLQPVTVARIEDDVAIIASGLTPGQVVVSDGQMRLAPGAEVVVAPPKDASAAPDASGQPMTVRAAP